ncbi:MAG: hypothetical protein JWP27_1643, partial [Flaviaesturariibacter sp.]|nr:hypothetical protein [Flaviaesturariibacter sp.]
MKSIALSFIALAATIAGSAQTKTTTTTTTATSSASAPTPATEDGTARAVYASARGNDSYLLYSKEGYKAGKKYVILKFWNAADPLTAAESADLAYLKEHLAKKGVDVVVKEWKDQADLQAAVKEYGLSADVAGDSRINIKGFKFNLNT